MATITARLAGRSHLMHADTARSVHVAIGTMLATVRAWHARTCLRRELRALNDHFLADIGMSRAEAAKPFWQA